VRVERAVARRPDDVLDRVCALLDVLLRAEVEELLGEPEVDSVHAPAVANPDPETEVVGLHVAVDDSMRVEVLDAREDPVRELHDNRQGKLVPARGQQVFQRRADALHHNEAVRLVLTEREHAREPRVPVENAVHSLFAHKLRGLPPWLKLDGNLLERVYIDAELYRPKRSLAECVLDSPAPGQKKRIVFAVYGWRRRVNGWRAIRCFVPILPSSAVLISTRPLPSLHTALFVLLGCGGLLENATRTFSCVPRLTSCSVGRMAAIFWRVVCL